MKKLLFWCFGMLVAWSCSAAAETVLNDDFSTNAAGDGVPAGWLLYRQGPTQGKIGIREASGGKVLYLKDVCDKSEIGITRRLSAVPGKYYRLTARVDSAGSGIRRNDASLQLRFLSRPNQVNNVRLESGKTAVASGKASDGKMQIYIFTAKGRQPEFTVSFVKLEVSDQPFQ